MATAAVIFDMDGLLVDTERLQFGASDMVLRDRGKGPISRDVMVALIGRRSDECWAYLRERYGLDESESDEELEVAQAAHYAPMLREQAASIVNPGVRELIAALREQRCPMAIASSSPLWQIEIVVEQLGLREVIAARASGEEVARGKPAPDVYLLAAERLGIAPARCVAFEDSGPGTLAAKAAGMYAIAVPSEETRGHDFSRADLVLPSLVGAAPRVTQLLGLGYSRQ